MRPRHVLWVLSAGLILVIAIGLSGCGGGAKGIVNVDAAKAVQLIDAGNVKVVDVRTSSEFEAGHIKGAENVPVDQVASVMASWDKTKPVLVYCATGSRSASAVQELNSMGFKTIYHLSAGIISWQGPLDAGSTTPVAQGPAVQTNGTPVMYEFFTDW